MERRAEEGLVRCELTVGIMSRCCFRHQSGSVAGAAHGDGIFVLGLAACFISAFALLVLVPTSTQQPVVTPQLSSSLFLGTLPSLVSYTSRLLQHAMFGICLTTCHDLAASPGLNNNDNDSEIETWDNLPLHDSDNDNDTFE